MGILEANADSLRLAAEAPQPAPTPDPPGMFHNFWSSAGNYAMRGMAEAGRALSMAGAVVPVVADKLIGSDNRSTSLTDRYFKAHDDYFGAAVDYWTPKPEEVGAAGQITGSLAAGIVQFLANPALVVGTSMLSTSEDLVRKGVPADAALVAGDVAGIATAAGIALPIFGKGLASRVATGAGGNLATNIPQAAITQQIVTAAGKPELAQDFDPWDVRARTVDVLLGAVFGGKAHFDARVRDALMATNAARHIESASLPVRGANDAELTQAVDSTRLAIEQLSRGERVAVPEVALRGDMEPALPADHAAEMGRLVDESLPPEPIARPDMTTREVQNTRDCAAAQTPDTPQAPQFPDSVKLPTNEFDPATGTPKYITATEAIAKAQADAVDVKTRAVDFMRVAATCLLGGI